MAICKEARIPHKDMENNVCTISADYAAHTLLCNLDNYLITTEADLELLKSNGNSVKKVFLFGVDFNLTSQSLIVGLQIQIRE